MAAKADRLLIARKCFEMANTKKSAWQDTMSKCNDIRKLLLIW